ncbi:MAG TPA: hypothetical protein VM658_19515 [bacterium]|nr:hypothetical protein [bacterium]
MSKECPKCRRPNSDKALRCIYCAAVFPETTGPEVKAPAAGEASPKPAPPADVFLVILSPRQKIPAAMFKGVSAELNLDPFTTRQKLKSPAPWTARTCHDAAPAQELVRRLAALGVDAYVAKQSGIERLLGRIQALGIKTMADDETVFLDALGAPTAVRHDDVFLVVRGRVREKAERDLSLDEDAPAVKLGKLAVGAQSGGGEKSPIREAIENFQVRPRPGLLRWTLKGHNIEIADIYRKSTPRSVRIVESEFDYSGLGPEMTASGLLNFNQIIAHIISGDPAPPVDLSFNVVGYSMSEVPKQDKVRSELEAAFGTSESAKKLYDNRAVFDGHSARVYLHYLRESRKPASEEKKD